MNAKVQDAFASAIGLRSRMVDRIQEVEPWRRKVVESVGLLLVLGIIYSVYLKALWSIPVCRVVELDAAYLLVLLKFLMLTGWPFALLAFLDDSWRSKDAGRIFLAAFLTANAYWMHKYHHSFCQYSFAFEIFPYVFSALVGHAIGAAVHLNKEHEDLEPIS
jgi:hypothetical protein